MIMMMMIIITIIIIIIIIIYHLYAGYSQSYAGNKPCFKDTVHSVSAVVWLNLWQVQCSFPQ